ncbi:MAG TPA: PAS domain S-box protein [Geomonas sp.]|nr:PAS domain S-box protein [Geomonas sp.]
MKRLREIQADQVELERKIEELRRSQEALEASRNQYALLYDFAPVAYFTFERNGKIRTVNGTGLRMFGLQYPDLVGRRFDDFVAARERLVFLEYLGLVFKSPGKKTCRVELVLPTWERLWVRIEAMVTESGEECLAVLVDITEKRLAEQALSESEYNLAKAQSMTHVGSWSFDPATACVKASDELLRIMRLAPGEATQESFAAAVHPGDRDKVIEHLQRGIEKGTSYEIEHRLQFADGSCRWVYSIVEPSVDGLGKVVRVDGTTQDITERKQAEVELSNKTSELQAIFDSISDGIVVYDHQARLQHHNQVAPQLFSDGAMVAGKGCGAVFHPDQEELPDACPVERAVHGERVETSLVVAREGGQTLYLDITASPIKDALGEKTRALVFFRDMSEKRLQEMRLIQAEKMSSIGVLATGIAHEINNPLASVAGCAEALQRRFRDAPELKEDQRLDVFPRYLEVITRESYRCKGIIDSLLNFGRKSEGLSVNVDMNAILLEIAELIAHQSKYRRIRLATTLKDCLPCVEGDPSALRQVCMNLLMNAHQAIAGEGMVEVVTSGPERGMISIAIRDTGCGIPKDNIDRIWDPFFTTKEAGNGTGLGLALTYSIVKRHSGEIRVESSPGQGTLFTVLLPVSRR